MIGQQLYCAKCGGPMTVVNYEPPRVPIEYQTASVKDAGRTDIDCLKCNPRPENRYRQAESR